MITYPYISVKSLIADVRSELRRFDISSAINETDCFNWAIDCIREIGGANYPEKTSDLIEIVNHQGELPVDFYKVKEMYLCYMDSVTKAPIEFYDATGNRYVPKIVIHPGSSSVNNRYSVAKPLVGVDFKNVFYYIKFPNVITLSMREAKIGLTYLSLPIIDNEIVIQDEIYSLKATRAYVKSKILEDKVYSQEVPVEMYQLFLSEYETNLSQAQAIFKFPDPADFDSFGEMQDGRYDDFKLK